MEKTTNLISIRKILIGTALLNFSFSATTPVVQLYFIKLIEPSIYAMSNTIGLIASYIANQSMKNLKFRNFFLRNYKILLIYDSIVYALICLLTIDYPSLRFLFLASINLLIINIIGTIEQHCYNISFKDDNLTNNNLTLSNVKLLAMLVGSIVGIIVINFIHIEIAIWFQVLSNVVNSIFSWYGLKKLIEEKFL